MLCKILLTEKSGVSMLFHRPAAVTSRLVPTNSSIINTHQVSGQVI